MQSSHNRSRRKRGKNANNGDDGGGLAYTAVSRAEDAQTDAYGRSRPHAPQHQTDTYIPSSSRSTLAYDTSRDGPSSHADSQDRFYPHSSDAHHRGGRDVVDTRDGDHWGTRPSHETQYQSGSRDRTPRDSDQGYSAAHRNESQGWGTVDNQDDGPQRGTPSPDWPRGEQEDDRSKGWDNKRNKEPRAQGNRRWQSDNGWETRKRDRNQNRRPDNQDDSSLSKEDRSWEPGPGWHGRGGDQGHRNQRGRSGQGKNKGKKNNQHRQRQQGDRDREPDRRWDRDRRNDNDNLNNWQRRELHPLPPKPSRSPVKRVSSPSPSRSRTPDSVYSRRSSRGRSRSRSFSPHLEPRHSSPPRPRSRTPPERGWGGNRSKSPVSSHRGSTGRAPPRRGSVSSLSSYSRSRSRSSSQSPGDRPRTKHRLPPATSIREISISISKNTLQQRSNLLTNQDPESVRNGKAQVNGKHPARPPASPESERQATERMPPPDVPPTSGSQPWESNSTLSPTLARRDTGSPTRAKFTKSAGFRPIGLASSSVKMFFPRDDEEPEEEMALMHHALPARPEVPAKRTHEDEGSLRRTRKRHDLSPLLQEADSESKEVIVEPRPPSPVMHDASKVLLSPKANRSGDVVTPTQQLRPTEPEVDGATRPLSPSMTSRKELYAIVSQVGEGTFGKVYKARNTITNVHVALKRIRMEVERDGFPVTAMREIKLLQSLRHQNVVRLYEMMVSNGSVFMVFEYMDHDLTGVLSQTQFSFSEANLKSLCSQMLAGLAYLHHKGVIHRDIKGSNILINNRGELKLADFGLARFYQKRRRSDYTNRVITLWYRPPELLFGATVYGPEVDMWSAGCIMLELFTKKPIFQGNDEIHQLDVIYRIFGTPTPERWPGITELPWYELVKPKEVIPNHFRELFQRWLSPAALDLAEQLLTYDPTKRATAVQALDAPYFKEELPSPELPIGLSSLEGEWHELETKRERAKKRRKLEIGLQPQPV